MTQVSHEIFALIFGAVIVVVFSYDRFNRVTYETGTRLERLVTLLSPDKLRARRVVIRVWSYYCLGLLVIYAILCVYFQVLPNIGLEAPTGAQNPDEKSIGIPPSVSLTAALILTGLAPSVPVLRRIEEMARVAAHRVAGIPTRLLRDTDVLRRRAMNLDKGDAQDNLMIPKGYWERRDHYRSAADGQVTDPRDFGSDLDLIFAVSSWILNPQLKLESGDIRESFHTIEEELRNRKDVLILELDERTNFVPGGTLAAEVSTSEQSKFAKPAETNNAIELKRKSWDRIALDADKLAEDMCILMALYVEHGLVPRTNSEIAIASEALGTAAATTGSTEARLRSSVKQHDTALRRLNEFLDDIHDAEGPEQQPSFALQTFLWSMVLILVLTCAWSLWPGVYELGLRFGGETLAWHQRILKFTFIALNGFVVPIGIFLFLRDLAKQSTHSIRWQNVWRVHWTTAFSQIGSALFLSWALSMLLVVTASTWNSAFRGELGDINAWRNLAVIFESEVLVIWRGCMLGLIVVLFLDEYAVPNSSLAGKPSWRTSLPWGLATAIVVGAFGALARATQSYVSARQWSRDGLDEIDMGLIFYATVYSALIGFVVLFFLSEILLNQRSFKRRNAAAISAQPAE